MGLVPTFLVVKFPGKSGYKYSGERVSHCHFERMTMKKQDNDSGSFESVVYGANFKSMALLNVVLTILVVWLFPNFCVLFCCIGGIIANSLMHHMSWNNREIKKIMGKQGTFYRKYAMESVAFQILILWMWSLGGNPVFWMVVDQLRANRPQVWRDAEYYLT